jgi:hypothetical protein
MKLKRPPEEMNRTQLETAWKLITEEGMSCLKASMTLHVSNATLARYVAKLRGNGGDIEAALEGKGTTGRPVVFEPNGYEVARARWFRLAKESLTVAAWYFARDEEVSEEGHFVREETKQVILDIEEKALRSGRKEAWPESVRRAFRVTEEEKAAFRGAKHSQQTEMVTRRGMYEVLADGSTRPILPGETWEWDDYSANQPFIFRDPATGEYQMGRQVLAVRDLCAARWLAFDHIGRERDAYRGEDILRTMERAVRAWGKPRRMRLERGTWESNFIHGIELPGTEKRWGDLRDLFFIEHVFKSKSKGIIEGGFHVLQRWLGHTGTDIGRVRGEFEEATRRLRMARDTGVDPLTLGFLTQEKSSVLHEEAGALVNSRPMQREHLDERVSPDDLVARLGWHTTPLRAEEAWYFLPYKALRTVRAGTVNVSPGNGWAKQYFQLNGVRDGVHFESGHQVLIAYDPARPELGAYVCNGDRSARNREGWKLGELLIPSAPEMGLAPQHSAARALSPHLVVRKKASAAAATSFRAIRSAAGLPQASGKHEAVAMNGQGGVAKYSDLPQAAPAAETGPIPESVRQMPAPVRDLSPALSSRPLPPGRTRAEEIARLRELAEAEF